MCAARTEGFHDTEQLQAAASAMLVPLRVTADPGPGFEVRISSAPIGHVVAARIQGSAHSVIREPRQITSRDPDLLKVMLHRGGSAVVCQNDRRERVRPGNLVALDTTRPYQLIISGLCDVVVIGLPRGMLGPHADRISGSTATAVAADTATRTLIATFLSGLGEHIAELPSADVHLADALAGLLIAAFADTTPERLDLASSLTDRILAFALANLADPTLCAHTVARRHGISARHLHHLLHRRGQTFAAWVREQRLHHIRRDLADPDLASRTTAAIAARWGVHDAGHLARALKQRYGQTAVEIQRSGRSR